MIFTSPIWIILIIPAALSIWLWRAGSKTTAVLRAAIIILIILAMAGLAVKFPSKNGLVVFLCDRSASMPTQANALQLEMIDTAHEKITAADEMAVISFAADAAIEKPPGKEKFTQFTANHNKEASNLNLAIEKALSLIENDKPARIIALTDGLHTGTSPKNAAAKAAARQIPIDYRLLQKPAVEDFAITQIHAPQNLNPAQAYIITAWLQCPKPAKINYRLNRNSSTISSGTAQMPAGLGKIRFRDIAPETGTLSYQLIIEPNQPDAINQNNSAKFLAAVDAPKNILLLTDNAKSGLGQLLTKSGLQIKTAEPENTAFNIETLSSYSALILEDVLANKIGPHGMRNIAAWTNDSGGGLMMTGGKNSFGPGGYYKSPIEPILPVSMELRQEHRKLAIAIVVALDRSGSMGMPVGFGKTKMDLANIAAAQVLDMLSPMDQFGVIAVDSSPHLIVDLDDVPNVRKRRNKILSIESMGGGIFVFEALSAAAKLIADAQPVTKHIILFSDAADSEQPGQYIQLLEQCEKAGITVTVIGLGTENDPDANLLIDIAQRGKGRIFFTKSAEELPRLFAQDTFIVARSAFLDEPVTVSPMAPLLGLTGQMFQLTETAGGYNLCYIRENANTAFITNDEYTAPFLAYHNTGIGRALAYTGQADGPYTGQVANSQNFGQLLTSAARWTAGKDNSLSDEFIITQDIQDAKSIVKLHLDPERKKDPFTAMPYLSTLRGIPGARPQKIQTSMRFDDPDTLIAQIPLTGSDTELSTVVLPDGRTKTLSPTCLPYSPEFAPRNPQLGRTAMTAIAAATSGTERINTADIWSALPRKPQLISLAPALIIIAIVLFLLEIIHRRMGLLTAKKLKISALAKIWKERDLAATHKKPKTPKLRKQKKPTEQKTEKQKTKPPRETQQPTPLFDALKQARNQARQRTKK